MFWIFETSFPYKMVRKRYSKRKNGQVTTTNTAAWPHIDAAVLLRLLSITFTDII